MRKRSKRNIRAAEIPFIVMSEIVPEAQIALFTAFQAFREGWAEPAHFDAMLDTRDLLLLGSKAQKETDTVEAARAVNVALANIRDSWDGKKFKLTDDELNVLQILVDVSIDFWNRQSGALYQAAYSALKKRRLEQREDQREQTGTN